MLTTRPDPATPRGPAGCHHLATSRCRTCRRWLCRECDTAFTETARGDVVHLTCTTPSLEEPRV